MVRILAVFYTQSGQLKDVVNALTAPLEEAEDVEVHYERIEPDPDFPFPWKAMDFFDAFPESVKEIPCPLKPFSFDPETDYDLILLFYQPWFLSPSIPITSFLQSEAGQKVMKDTPVVTVSASRNMWITAQEKIKARIDRNGARLVGNIALVDPHSNLVSLVTILAWMLKGKREGFMGIFPRSGVPPEDIDHASFYGEEIRAQLRRNIEELDQRRLNELGAVRIVPNLMVLEERGARAFGAFSGFIRKKGPPGAPGRRARLKLFAACLFPGILILSPITILSTHIILLVRRKKIRRDLAYYAGVALEEG